MSIQQLIVIFCFTFITLGETHTSEQYLADYYLNLVINRTKAAEVYEFPKDSRIHEAETTNLEEYGEFDFIIVGAGSTGCVIANRLSEIADWKVLLLEAGTYADDELTGIPALWLLDGLTKFNWGFETTPQNHACLGNVNRKCKVPRGKGIGGSSLINGILYTRGNELDYKLWSEAVNDSIWNYENVLPYFKKSETFTKTNPYSPIDEDYHGHEGPLQMTHCEPSQKITDYFLKGTQELGYNITDYNGKQQLGASIFQVYSKNGKRFSPDMAFISPIKDRKNLFILDKSFVTKLEIDKETKKVTGVIFTREGKTYRARNSREVILSAGVIGSPQILMWSGVGPKDHLESLGIPVVHNLPVGDNLRDHTFTFFIFSSNNTDDYETLEQMAKNYVKGQGTLTRPFTYEVVGWLQTSLNQHENFPDIELFFFNISDVPFAKKLTGWTDETYEALNVKAPNAFVMILAPGNARSKGTLRLKSADPFVHPLIDLNLLSDDEDIEILYEGVQLLMKLIETEAMRKINVTLAVRELPGCEHTKLYSKEYWYCYFRQLTGVGHHQVGSCSASTGPETGVVNSKLKVFGIEDLRIADASIIPFTLSAHPNAVCTMIGEKVSDLIKEEYENII